MYVPGFLVADSAAGILVAGMISLTGCEVLVESIKQLTDASDDTVTPHVFAVARSVEGVKGVKNVRARSVGSGSLVDLTVLTETKLSTSAAHAIAESTRWRVMESLPQVLDVLVRTQAMDTIQCPLLLGQQRSTADIEADIRQIIAAQYTSETVLSVDRVTLHYVSTARVSAEVLLTLSPALSIDAAKEVARDLKRYLAQVPDIFQSEIQLSLSGITDTGFDSSSTLQKSFEGTFVARQEDSSGQPVGPVMSADHDHDHDHDHNHEHDKHS